MWGVDKEAKLARRGAVTTMLRHIAKFNLVISFPLQIEPDDANTELGLNNIVSYITGWSILYNLHSTRLPEETDEGLCLSEAH